jgi:hypothetical protein
MLGLHLWLGSSLQALEMGVLGNADETNKHPISFLSCMMIEYSRLNQWWRILGWHDSYSHLEYRHRRVLGIF